MPAPRRAYRRHLSDAMRALGVATLADLTPPMLAACRAAISMTLAPSSQAQALAAVRRVLA